MRTSFEFEGLSDLLPDIDEVGVAMAEAAGPVLVEETKRAVQSVVEHDGDSELVNSVSMSKARKGKYGDYIVSAYFKGESKTKTYRHSKNKGGKKHPVSNSLKGVWKVYGILHLKYGLLIIPLKQIIWETIKYGSYVMMGKYPVSMDMLI